MAKWVYGFGGGRGEGDAGMKALLGGKGANLAEMASLGLPVPPGFTITTEVCTYFYANDRRYPDDLTGQVEAALGEVERHLGVRFGDPDDPLLVSVRSGAPVSMPGMMDTVLNLGLNDLTVEGLAARSGDARFAYDSYRRFIQMYGDVVLEVDHYRFEEALEEAKQARGVRFDTDLDADDLARLVRAYKAIVAKDTGKEFPQDPKAQLWGAIGAVFGSWQTARAVTYRRLNDIPSAMGTAVTVQAMVFGNMGEDCATGVAFTRNPSTGREGLLRRVPDQRPGRGRRRRHPHAAAADRHDGVRRRRARRLDGAGAAATFAELAAVFDRLERHYRDMQDIEFTVQQGKLFVLQTRSASAPRLRR
jgi:pyruvate,orthophosphate dikinase